MTSAENLIREYTKGYMEKVYYFCLKKTGCPDGADELTQDVSLRIISSLTKGACPENFSAYVWQTARNCYADYSEKRRKMRERSGGDVSDLDIADTLPNPEERFIMDEQLSILRRELAFISQDYREIVVAFYISNRSVKDIASSLRLPENTVKSKLHRARKILKEGMNMAREFGPKSYKPESIYFSASGEVYGQTTNMPCGGVQRASQRNILLEASNNPSTIEELAVALGIAVPYMEEEVKILTDGTLLKQVGNKYITNFPILSADTQLKLSKLAQRYAPERARLVNNVAEASIEGIKALGCIRNGKITDDELKWWIVCAISHYCMLSSANFDIEPRENGQRWGFVGYEEAPGIERGFGLSNENDFGSAPRLRLFIVYGPNVGADIQLPAIAKVSYFFAEILKNHRNVNSFTGSELQLWKKIDGVYAHSEPDGTVVPDILVFEGAENIRECPSTALEVFKKHPDFEKIISIDKECFNKSVELLKGENSEVLAKQLEFTTSMAEPLLPLSLKFIVENGMLKIPDDPGHLGAMAELWY